MTARSAEGEKSSTGEKPRVTAIQSVTQTSAAVSAILGHALSSHWPPHVQVHRLLNGNKYGIGHPNPSGPRDPTRSSKRCKWKLTKANAAGIHLFPATKKANTETSRAKSNVCRSWWNS